MDKPNGATPPDLEGCELVDERFEHGDFGVTLWLPASPIDLVDPADFDRDERMPYWSELWPAAKGLTRFLLDQPPRDAPTRVLELGCGVGLPSLALRHLGGDPLATDWYRDALRFAAANAARNALGPLRTRHLDWTAPDLEERFDLILAADVLYEPRHVGQMARLLQQLLASGGRALVADPRRKHLGDFLTAVQRDGAVSRRLAEYPEIGPPQSKPANVDIWEVRLRESDSQVTR